MIKIEAVTDKAPSVYVSDVQEAIYEAFEKLGIPFKRVDCEPAITMEDCLAVDRALDVKTAKTILLNNQQKTKFYLFVTPGEKRFDCKAFSKALGIARTSFADAEHFHKYMHADFGAASLLTVIRDKSKEINVIIDADVLKDEYIGFNDATAVSYLKLKTSDVFEKYLKYTEHGYTVINL